jgi:predicted dehydrogenase
MGKESARIDPAFVELDRFDPDATIRRQKPRIALQARAMAYPSFMKEGTKLNWGIIGTGNIAKSFARNVPPSRTGRLVAAASRTQESADAFGKEFPGTRLYASYEAMLADPEVQAVYISTPHPMHLEWMVATARAGKHILCEKPFTMNHREAAIAVEAAREHDVFLMEAFMYRCLPQTARVVEIVRSGQLGELRLIDATFAFDTGAYKPESRLFRQDLGGGAILDVGCYCMSMTRLLAGAAVGEPFAEPLEIRAVGRLGESGVDEQAQALLTFENGLQARLITALRLGLGASVVVHGSKGALRILSPWFGGQPTTKLEIVAGGKTEEIVVESPGGLYSYEIDNVADNLDRKESTCMPIADTLGNMAALDRWRAEIGLVYELEK